MPFDSICKHTVVLLNEFSCEWWLKSFEKIFVRKFHTRKVFRLNVFASEPLDWQLVWKLYYICHIYKAFHPFLYQNKNKFYEKLQKITKKKRMQTWRLTEWVRIWVLRVLGLAYVLSQTLHLFIRLSGCVVLRVLLLIKLLFIWFRFFRLDEDDDEPDDEELLFWLLPVDVLWFVKLLGK